MHAFANARATLHATEPHAFAMMQPEIAFDMQLAVTPPPASAPRGVPAPLAKPTIAPRRLVAPKSAKTIKRRRR
jgi:hypothetical protein